MKDENRAGRQRRAQPDPQGNIEAVLPEKGLLQVDKDLVVGIQEIGVI